MAERNVKKRHWAFVLYPESAPGDWMERLKLTGLKCAISPLHDRDVNPTGEPKKAHYHIIVSYDGPTTYKNVERLTKSLNQPIPQPLEQVKGYYRYLTHKDNPEKAQYFESDIVTLNGFNVLDFTELTRSEVGQITREIMTFIRDNNILEYTDLMEILQDGGPGLNAQFEVARSSTLFFTAYLRSRRYKATGRDHG